LGELGTAHFCSPDGFGFGMDQNYLTRKMDGFMVKIGAVHWYPTGLTHPHFDGSKCFFPTKIA